jgi:hypothetical protein
MGTAALAILVSGAMEMIIPVNKALWTASFVTLTGGFACLGLALALLVTDVLGRRGSAIAVGIAYGRNPLLLFVASGVVARLLTLFKVGDASVKDWIYRNVFAASLPPVWASFLWAASLVGLFAVVAADSRPTPPASALLTRGRRGCYNPAMTFDPNKAALHDGVFGLPHGADDARVHLIPVPFEATTSYGGGTAGGPAAISRPAAKSTCTTSTSAIRGRSAST